MDQIFNLFFNVLLTPAAPKWDSCKLDSFIGNYDNFLLVGDLNSEIVESSMHDFCNSYNLHSLCHKSTCYKNPEKPSCIDLFLTNSPKSFQNTQTIETGLSDFHKLVVTILKMYLPNNQPKIKSCCMRLRNLDH